MKIVARGYFWWQGLDSDIEHMVRSCLPCQSVKRVPHVATLHPWTWPTRPWQQDFAGPFQGFMFFIIVDARSKWPEVFMMTQTTASKTIALLRQTFAAYGLPDQVVTDNGPQFMSEEFVTFLKSQGVKHVQSAPYHAASNGLAERFVQSLKQALNASKDDGRSVNHRLHDYLLTYRTTPHTMTGVSQHFCFYTELCERLWIY